MKRSNRLILLIGVFLAIVAFVGIVVVFQGRGSSNTGTQTPTELPTVFATKAITLGTPITAEMLKKQNVAVTSRDTTAFADPSLLLGKIARKDIAQGKQLTADDFAVTTAPVTIDTPPGQRAIAVQVDQVSGVGTLIRTGDYVDVLVAVTGDKYPLVIPESIEPVPDAAVNETSAKLLLQGIQVIGTLLPPPPAETNRNQNENETQEEGGTALNGQQEIVILSVLPQQAEMIKFAQIDGSISLALRSPRDFRDPDSGDPIVPPPATTSGITLRGLIDDYGLIIPEFVEAILPEGMPTP